ncbi:MAG: hypothetical protein GY943_29660 [Chloroflexi bacterium]|nr:hypothetical protein [Chloroflexota bacterium]
MDEIIGIILITIISGGTLATLLSILIFLLPKRVSRTEQMIITRPGRAFLIGVVNFLFFGLIAAWLSGLGDIGGLLGGLILVLLLAFSAIGLSSVVQLLCTRIYPNADENRLKVTMKTAVLLIIATLTPIVGWFGLAPSLLLIGLGGAILTLRGH